MLFLSTYKKELASILIALVLSATAGQALHLLWAHRSDVHPHCQTKNGLVHLHTPEYGHAACSLCDFTLSVSELPALSCWHLPLKPFWAATLPVFYEAPTDRSGCFLPALRGPPNV